MPRASLIIKFSEKGINFDGNEEIIWFLNNKSRKKFLEEILNLLIEYKKIKNRKGKMNIILIGIDEYSKEILEKYKEHFNFIFEKSYQTKVINFFK
ncbi:MAG: hypothetical protein QXQ91_01600 [Nanopusillaceae archaeon]